jgi:hypothetical protein
LPSNVTPIAPSSQTERPGSSLGAKAGPLSVPESPLVPELPPELPPEPLVPELPPELLAAELDAVPELLAPPSAVGFAAGASSPTHASTSAPPPIYRKLPAAERAKLHATAARALEDHLGGKDDHERVGEVASHLVEAAALGDVDHAVDLSLHAAELAVAAGDVGAAQEYATRGLDAFRFAQKVDEERKRRLSTFTTLKDSASASTRRASS